MIMDKPRDNEELELRIESLAFGGRGVARRSGFVIFVDGALPGDLVRARIIRSRRSYAEARALEVIEASEARIKPECRHFGVCGGCAWQTLEYDTQLKYKQQQVRECLSRIGGLQEFEMDPPLGAGSIWRYRNKVEYSFAGDGDDLELGFHLPGDWQRVLDVRDCRLHSTITNGIRNFVREFASASGAGAYTQRSGRGFWRHLVLREAAHTGEIMVKLVTGPGNFPDMERFAGEIVAAFPQVASLLWSVNPGQAAVATGFPFRVLAGRDHIVESIGGLELEVSPSSFLQTNTVMAGKLYEKALDYADLAGNELVYDLYSGIGSIALFFSRRCREVFGVEIVAEAAAAASINARRNRINNASFRQGKVRAVLKEILETGGGPAGGGPAARLPDLVILDPPRAGASRKEMERVIGLAPDRLVYVSCNAATLAANAAQLAEEGYRLIRAGAVDMFPHTPHIEVVASFEKI